VFHAEVPCLACSTRQPSGALTLLVATSDMLKFEFGSRVPAECIACRSFHCTAAVVNFCEMVPMPHDSVVLFASRVLVSLRAYLRALYGGEVKHSSMHVI
jgi:hypothetical protein